VLILGILSLVPVMFLWLARRIAQMTRATIPAHPSLTWFCSLSTQSTAFAVTFGTFGSRYGKHLAAVDSNHT
jgi:hypothetical protein